MHIEVVDQKTKKELGSIDSSIVPRKGELLEVEVDDDNEIQFQVVDVEYCTEQLLGGYTITVTRCIVYVEKRVETMMREVYVVYVAGMEMSATLITGSKEKAEELAKEKRQKHPALVWRVGTVKEALKEVWNDGYRFARISNTIVTIV